MSRDDFSFDGRCTVVARGDDTATLMPCDDLLGAPTFAAPLSELPDLDLGAVLSGVFLCEDGVWLVDATQVGRAERVKATKSKAGWQLGKGKNALVVPFVEGLTDQQRDWLAACPFWRFVEGGRGPGHFEDGRGLLAERVRQREADEAARQAERERRAAAAWPANRTFDPAMFVNPYNFVPLPQAAPQRREPVGHERRHPGLLHGTIDVTAVARTPLLLRDAEQSGGGEKQATKVPRRGGQIVVPGSSVKGSLRSAFEAITGSCLRVLDEGYAPGYRDVLRAKNKVGWSLIEVADVDSKRRPVTARICTDTIWVVLDVLQDVLGAQGVRTGARFRLVGAPTRIGERSEVRHRDLVAPASDPRGDEYVLLVTDVRARPGKKAVTFAAGRVPSDPVDVRVDDAAWSAFEAASDGAADNKRGSKKVDDEIAVSINTMKSRGEAVRQRQGVTSVGRVGLRPGHVLWARTERADSGVVITGLSFAQTWRHAPRGSAPRVADRTPAGYLPCTGADGLCPACRVFGAANTRGGREGGDRPYRGHVRFHDWAVQGSATAIDLAPMGQPRPGSAQLYLAHDSVPSGEDARARVGADALREWGSALDEPTPRPIRGRKMYWRASEAPGRPARHLFHRSHAGKDNKGTMASRAEVVGADARLTGRLVFENLSAAELGGILAALVPGSLKGHQHPGRAGADGTFCFTVGGGKPLGLGATEVTDVVVTLDGDRYDGGDPAAGSVADLVAAFVAAQPPEVTAVWADFLELVRLNAVDPALIGYPRDTAWPERGDSADLYAAGFTWWKASAGMPWDGLGSADDEVQSAHSYAAMPVATAAEPRQLITIEGVPAPGPVKAQMKTHATKGGR